MNIFNEYEKSFSLEEPQEEPQEELDMGALEDMLRKKLLSKKIQDKQMSLEFQRRMKDFAKGIM